MKEFISFVYIKTLLGFTGNNHDDSCRSNIWLTPILAPVPDLLAHYFRAYSKSCDGKFSVLY